MVNQVVNSNRRQFLKSSAAVLAVGSAGLVACQKENSPKANAQTAEDATKNAQATAQNTGNTHCMVDLKYEFFGEHQSGIITPVQRQIYFLVVDLHTQDIESIKQMFKDWTDFSQKLMQGDNILPYGKNPHVPPSDTGEADSLGAYGLTLTFGLGLGFFKKLGLKDKIPNEFKDLPNFARDQIRPELSGGDICIQACADDPQVAFHAVRQLVRQARSNITMKWSQAGFNSFDSDNHTPRNLFGFKDGTANKLTLQDADKHIWAKADSPKWFVGGTYLVARVIQMHLETWDRTSLKGQEDTFSRHRHSGAPIGSQDEFDAFDANAKDANGKNLMPDIGHTTLANKTGLQILRRSFSYSSGIDSKTGQFDAGLLFISFQQSPEQFVVMQNALGRVDKMNEYTTHIGSGLFACLGGVTKGEYLGQKLFEN